MSNGTLFKRDGVRFFNETMWRDSLSISGQNTVDRGLL